MREKHGLGEDLIKGAIAGAVATWVMGKVTNTMYEREDRWARRHEDDAREGKTSYGVAAEKAGRALGASLDKDQNERVGAAIHWALGIGAGAVYAVVRRRLPREHSCGDCDRVRGVSSAEMAKYRAGVGSVPTSIAVPPASTTPRRTPRAAMVPPETASDGTPLASSP